MTDPTLASDEQSFESRMLEIIRRFGRGYITIGELSAKIEAAHEADKAAYGTERYQSGQRDELERQNRILFGEGEHEPYFVDVNQVATYVRDRLATLDQSGYEAGRGE